jgi:hypothetical protein
MGREANFLYIPNMQTSFLRKTLIANEQNSAIHIPVEWYGTEIEIIAFPVEMQKQNFNDVQDNKMNALSSFLNFADSHKVIEKDFCFDREACYDR